MSSLSSRKFKLISTFRITIVGCIVWDGLPKKTGQQTGYMGNGQLIIYNFIISLKKAKTAHATTGDLVTYNHLPAPQ